MPSSPRSVWLFPLLALAACYPLVASPDAPSPQAAPAPEQAPVAPDPDRLDKKLETYVECYNRLDGAAHRTIKRYVSWVKDMKAGPTGKEKVIYGLYSLSGNDIRACRERFAEAQKLKPELALDGLAGGYIQGLEGLSQVVEEMYPYYDRENYKDDKFAKGKQLHARFAAQVEQFQKVSQGFSAELDVRNDQRLEAQMAQLEREQGRKLPYLNMATMYRAKLLVRLVGEESFPLDQVNARLEAFEKAADEEIQYAKDSPQGLSATWSLFVSQIEEFRKAVKERMRRARDKVPYETGEAMMINAGSAWMVSGSPGRVVRAYNDLVAGSNNLR